MRGESKYLGDDLSEPGTARFIRMGFGGGSAPGVGRVVKEHERFYSRCARRGEHILLVTSRDAPANHRRVFDFGLRFAGLQGDGPLAMMVDNLFRADLVMDWAGAPPEVLLFAAEEDEDDEAQEMFEGPAPPPGNGAAASRLCAHTFDLCEQVGEMCGGDDRGEEWTCTHTYKHTSFTSL